MRSLSLAVLLLLVPPASGSTLTIEPILGWAAESAARDQDCPMPLERAGQMRDFQKGDGIRAALVRGIGCTCHVEIHCGETRSLGEYRCDLPTKVRQFRPKNPEEQALLAWGQRLLAKRKLEPKALSRAEPLPAADKAAQVAAARAQEEKAPAFITMLRLRRDLDRGVQSELWFQLPGLVKSIKSQLEHLEKVTLCGEKSVPGRALLADAEAEVAKHRKKIQQWAAMERKLEADPRYRKLGDELERVRAQAEELAQARGVSSYHAACSSQDRTKMCELKRREDAVNDELAAIYRKHGFKP